MLPKLRRFVGDEVLIADEKEKRIAHLHGIGHGPGKLLHAHPDVLKLLNLQKALRGIGKDTLHAVQTVRLGDVLLTSSSITGAPFVGRQIR